MNLSVIGIDISKSTFDAYFELKSKPQRGKFENTTVGCLSFEEWLRKLHVDNPLVCMEATGRYYELLAYHCASRQVAVSVVNPNQVKRFGESQLRRNKSDRADAKLICQYGERMDPRLWQPLPEARRDLQEIRMVLDGTKKMLVQEQNRSQACLRNHLVIDIVAEHINGLKDQKKRLEQLLINTIKEDQRLSEDLQLLLSIPGIGMTTAVGILARIDVMRFKSARKLAAHAGLTPSEYSSGTSVSKKDAISRVGDKNFRTMFYWPAISAMTCNPRLKAFADGLRARNKPGKVIICAVMRKQMHLVYGVLKTRKPFDPNYVQTKGLKRYQ